MMRDDYKTLILLPTTEYGIILYLANKLIKDGKWESFVSLIES